jgi:4a-hydroxytetrahydrobiopterin dehydratase
MSEPKALTAQEIETRLGEVQGWRVHEGKLRRELKFPSFVEAFGFLTSLAIVAERINHNTEIYNVYNRVTLDLVTHDANGISKLDFELATVANKLSAAATG